MSAATVGRSTLGMRRRRRPNVHTAYSERRDDHHLGLGVFSRPGLAPSYHLGHIRRGRPCPCPAIASLSLFTQCQ